MAVITQVAAVLGISCIALLVCGALNAAPNAELPKRYRLIFNCDGHAVCMDAGGELEQWIENVFGPLADSQVDALFWCDGAGGNTANYRSEVLELTGQRMGKPRPWIKKLLDAGYDPPEVIVREAKKRGLDVFYSFRINDIHDAFTPDELATFKVEHPEWLIGERKYGNVTSYRTGLNFAVPEVRELKFRVIEEIFRKYDFDGLEIDFLRSAPYFLPGEEAENAHVLTELLQRVREHLNGRGRERGRPIRLAARVDESLEACRLDGFEVREWIERGLVDYLILGSGVIDIEVEDFKRIAAPKGVPVYPCLYGWPSNYVPIPAELAAALALNYWQQGADGIYLFNWFVHTANNSEASAPYMAGLLKQLGDPAAILRERKHLMFAADRGCPQRSYPHNWMHCVLPAALPTETDLEVPIRVGVNLGEMRPAPSVTLRLAVENLQQGDVVAVTLNGREVPQPRQTAAGVLTAPLAPEQVKEGVNHASLRLADRSAESEAPRTVTALEIDVVFP